MEERKVKISSGKEYTVREVKYKDLMGVKSDDKMEAAKHILKLSTGITDEEFDDLSMRDGIMLQKTSNEVNGIGEDFLQQTQVDKNILTN